MKAKQGEVCLVTEIPKCDFCSDRGPYDFKTRMGPWAHGCNAHWREFRANPGFGVGKAQLWITEES
jgi:hypothetical protein